MTKNILKNKIDFVAFISVRGANPNGDPNNENLPRTDDEMYGEMSSGCIHRKIRNRMQDMGHKIYVQSEERTDDGYVCLSDRVHVRRFCRSSSSPMWPTAAAAIVCWHRSAVTTVRSGIR